MSDNSNYLDYIPVHSNSILYDIIDGKVTINKENRGLFNYLAQKLIKKPRVTQIHLDDMGSFIWLLIDGKKTIFDIAQLVKEKYGDAAEPLYDRLVQYFKTLSECSFITYKHSDVRQDI